MDRRSFLTLLGAAGVTLVVPKLWVPSPSLLPTAADIVKTCRIAAPADYVMDIILCGKNDRPEVATFDVLRPNGTKLLALAINTFGGALRWCAAPGEELMTPLTFEWCGNMTVNVVGMKDGCPSYTALEPDDNFPVLIPATATWDSHPALMGAGIPEVFRRAWGHG